MTNYSLLLAHIVYRCHTSDLEVFESVQHIWAYFYRDKEAVDWISDGVIEQWEFATEAAAEKALKKII